MLRDRGVEGINKMLKYDVFSHGGYDHYRMVFEKRDFDLLDYSDKFHPSELEAKNLARQLLRILTDMVEKAGLIHLDLKPENVLIDVQSKQIELCDLATCVFTDNEFISVPFLGTMAFAPPEQLSEIVFPLKSVVWSFALTVYLLLHTSMPWDEYENEDVQQTVQFKDGLSDEFKDFMFWCLEPNPKNRIDLFGLWSLDWLKN